jgi:oxygen-independent coproporphyrinogen-3 oxidase
MLAPLLSGSLADPLQADPYVGYAYSYPHKTAYRTLATPRPLRDVWSDERRDSLFLYLHIPFCEMRCGFCNLFTFSQPADEWVARYLRAIQQHMQVIAEAIPDAAFTRLAIGGGTPTFLKTAELRKLFEHLEAVLRVQFTQLPISVEASPATLDDDKLDLLRHYQVDRLSLGIQSFLPEDLGAMGRPQQMSDVWRAIDRVRERGFPVLNLDLIYGAQGQTRSGWLASLRAAAECLPEELYIYPLYVRPLTGLGAKQPPQNDTRLDRYREARDWLLASGYEQVSMRMFRRPGQTDESSPVYCCQSDGMIGLGVGARSYSRKLHYASRFAVRQKSILGVIQEFVSQSPVEMANVTHGFDLDDDEQRRRYVLLTLLQASGLDGHEYQQRFGDDPLVDFPQLGELLDLGLAIQDGSQLVLTAAGLERSDAIGPWLYSGEVSRRMQEFSWTDA